MGVFGETEGQGVRVGVVDLAAHSERHATLVLYGKLPDNIDFVAWGRAVCGFVGTIDVQN